MRANERNGPALERKPSRTASRSRRHERSSPRCAGSGRSKVAGSTRSSGIKIPVTSSSLPPSGRRINICSPDSGSTTHSLPRALTSEPTAKFIHASQKYASIGIKSRRKKRRFPVGAGVDEARGGDACVSLVPFPLSHLTPHHGRRKRLLPTSTPPPPLRDESASFLVFPLLFS